VSHNKTGIEVIALLSARLSPMLWGTCVGQVSTEIWNAGNVSVSEALADVVGSALDTMGSDLLEVSGRGGRVCFSFESPPTERTTVVGNAPLNRCAEIVVATDFLQANVRWKLVRSLDLRVAGVKCLAGLQLGRIVPLLERLSLPSGMEAISKRLCANLARLVVISTRHCTKLGVIGQEAFAGCVSLRRFRVSDGVKKIEWRAFSGARLLELDLCDLRLASANLRDMTWLERLCLPRTLETCNFSGAAALRTLVAGHLEAEEKKFGTCGGHPTTIHFRCFDAGMPRSFAAVSEKAIVFAEIIALAGRATRPSLSLQI
jgi:hypothetical protein